MYENNVNEIVESRYEITPKTALSKSNGYIDYSYNKCLIFYLSDLHIESYMKSQRSEKELNDIVDNLINSSRELCAALQYYKIKAVEEKCWELKKTILQINKQIEVTNDNALKNQLKELENEYERQEKQHAELELEILGGLSKTERKMIRHHYNNFYLILDGDISNRIGAVCRILLRIRYWVPDNRIIYVLGNHEISGYETLDEAVKDYKDMCSCSDLNVILLHNCGYVDAAAINTKENYEYGLEKHIYPIVDRKPGYGHDNIVFFGGIGFNQYDEVHNAKTIITSQDIQNNIDKEKEECRSFIKAYNDALEYCQQNKKVLVVISHYPIRDWMNIMECSNACYYFCGHNHKNESFESNGAYVFADNQIGYNAKVKAFRYVELLGMYNPYYAYNDGIYDINTRDYVAFYRFAGEGTIGTYGKCKKIENALAKGYKFFMIKKHDFYGFFMTNGSKVYICQGAGYTEISNDRGRDIKYYYDKFDRMVNRYIEALTPYRRFQEEISREIKKLQGSGEMHGLIVDYDYLHHIMINPFENILEFYYSPELGEAMNLKSIKGLLQHAGYNEITVNDMLMGIEDNALIRNTQLEEYIGDEEIQHVSISEGPYALSRKMKNIERIFTAGILRDWQDRVVEEIMLPNLAGLPG